MGNWLQFLNLQGSHLILFLTSHLLLLLLVSGSSAAKWKNMG
jgi:hypothetical protein